MTDVVVQRDRLVSQHLRYSKLGRPTATRRSVPSGETAAPAHLPLPVRRMRPDQAVHQLEELAAHTRAMRRAVFTQSALSDSGFPQTSNAPPEELTTTESSA